MDEDELNVYDEAMELVDAGEVVVILNMEDRLRVLRWKSTQFEDEFIYADDPEIREHLLSTLIAHAGKWPTGRRPT